MTAKRTERIRCVRSVGYASAGRVYDVEFGKREAYFVNVATGGGTSMPHWEYAAAKARGDFAAWVPGATG